MLRKTSHLLTGILAFCSLSAVTVVPAMAESTHNNQASEFTISQLRGHDIYNKSPQMNMSNYMIGTVVGQAGEVLSVKLSDGTLINGIMNADAWDNSSGAYYGGMNVRVVKSDNNMYMIVGVAHPAWILDLGKK